MELINLKISDADGNVISQKKTNLIVLTTLHSVPEDTFRNTIVTQ